MPSEKRAAPSTPEDRAVFYKLVNAITGEVLRGTKVDGIIIRTNALMFKVRDEIYAKHPIRCKHFEKTDLQVYQNEASFRMSTPLTPGHPMESFGSSEESPIILVVPVGGLWSFDLCEVPFYNNILTATETDGSIVFEIIFLPPL